MNIPRWGRGGSNRRGRPYISPQQGIIASTSFHNTTNVRVSRSNLVSNIPATLFSSLTDTTNKIDGINTSDKTISDTSFDHLHFNKRRYKSVSKCNIDDALNNSKKSKSSSNCDKLASTSGNSSNSKQKYKTNNLHSRGGLSTHSYTPCSTTSNTSISESCIIVAVTEGRGAAKGEVGMAAMDLKRPHLILCQLSDTHSYIHSLTRLNYLNPAEIIIPHTFNHGVNTTELFKLISGNFPNVRFTTVQRRFFSEANGLQQIKHLSAPGYANVQLQLIHKFYALTSAAALLKYIEHVQCVIYAPHSLKIEYFGSQNSTLIDMETTIRLELVESLSESFNRRNSLLSVLNYTQTLGGLRSLRANILQPSSDKNIINNRLDCIEELLQNSEGLMPSLNRVMKQFVDVDKVLWLCMILPTQDGNKAGEAQLNHTLLLKKTVGILPNLVEVLKLAKGSWFVKMRKDLEDPKFTEIREHINRVIQDDAHVSRGVSGHFQRCFAVRPEINSLLDIARRSYSEIITDIQDKVFQLSEEFGLPLRLNSNAAKGFHIILPTGSKNRSNIDISSLPPVFLEIQNHGSTITMTTEEVILLDQQARESLNEIQTMSNVIIYGLLKELRAYMGVLYKLCEHTAELDMILSLAYVSSSENYVRPIFENYLELKNSIHPILDSVIPTSPIPNDIFSSPEFNFHIITGPNMGGKSIYIKQIALLQIMAQIGCFVPARKAVFRIADSIFSRIGFNDSIESNASTYVLEMKEMQFILQTLTSTSLIIVDELCRGTSSEEGTSMAWVICERLLNSKAFTFFTTHFLYLTKLQDVYFNVVNLHTETTISKSDNDENKNNLVYKYKIIPGVTDVDRYGLALARNTNFPTCVLDMAEELSEVIALHKKPLPTEIHKEKSDILFYKAAAGLFQESRKNVNVDESLNTLIENFKIDNPQLGESILKKKDAYVSPKIQALSSSSKNNCTMKSPCEIPSNYSTTCSPISTITSLNFNSNLMTRNDNFMDNMKSLMGQMNVISRSKRQKVNDPIKAGFHTAPTVNQHDANKMTSDVSNFQQGENMFQLPLSNTLNKNIDYESIFCQPDLPTDCAGNESSFVDSSSD